MPLENLRLAVLIDADNAPRKYMKGVMEEIAIYGTPTIKRIYGDWTSPKLASWKKPLLENAITPIQQYAYTVGKNSTDSAMIIDAMDILYTNNVDGFCIVSSDSDFTRLATRLREAGMTVIGIGEKKTPAPFIVACDKFIYLEIIKSKARLSQKAEREAEKAAKEEKDKAAGLATQTEESGKESAESGRKAAFVPSEVEELIAVTIADIADEEGYAFLGELGNLLVKKQPDFDPRNFGFRKLTPLIASLERFELDVRRIEETGGVKHIYVKDKKA